MLTHLAQNENFGFQLVEELKFDLLYQLLTTNNFKFMEWIANFLVKVSEIDNILSYEKSPGQCLKFLQLLKEKHSDFQMPVAIVLRNLAPYDIRLIIRFASKGTEFDHHCKDVDVAASDIS
jgi:hypothetical protein